MMNFRLGRVKIRKKSTTGTAAMPLLLSKKKPRRRTPPIRLFRSNLFPCRAMLTTEISSRPIVCAPNRLHLY